MNGVVVPPPDIKIPNSVSGFSYATVTLLEPAQYAAVMTANPPASEIVTIKLFNQNNE